MLYEACQSEAMVLGVEHSKELERCIVGRRVFNQTYSSVRHECGFELVYTIALRWDISTRACKAH